MIGRRRPGFSGNHLFKFAEMWPAELCGQDVFARRDRRIAFEQPPLLRRSAAGWAQRGRGRSIHTLSRCNQHLDSTLRLALCYPCQRFCHNLSAPDSSKLQCSIPFPQSALLQHPSCGTEAQEICQMNAGSLVLLFTGSAGIGICEFPKRSFRVSTSMRSAFLSESHVTSLNSPAAGWRSTKCRSRWIVQTAERRRARSPFSSCAVPNAELRLLKLFMAENSICRQWRYWNE